MTDTTLAPPAATQAELAYRGALRLAERDPELSALLDREIGFQNDMLPLTAYASLSDPMVLAAGGSALDNVTAEGYPGARFHTGADQFDQVERLAVERAKALFGAEYANVQPHSCSSANLAVLFALVEPGGTVLGLDLPAGGHLTHGSAASVTGRIFHAVHYGVDDAGFIDYRQMAELAEQHRPAVIVAGASAYPRAIDYARFREAADAVGAYLLADISHIAGLVAAGVLPSPIDLAHATTTSTYKQLGGPRGGLILMGADHRAKGPDGRRSLRALFQQGVFPRLQGTPSAAAIAAKAAAFRLAAGPEFAATARLVADDAQALAAALARRGRRVLTGGTDNHLVLLDTAADGVTGRDAEQALRSCGVLVNRNQIAGDRLPPTVAGGIRLGTNSLAQRGFPPPAMERCAALVDTVLGALRPDGGGGHRLDGETRARAAAEAAELCAEYPYAPYRI